MVSETANALRMEIGGFQLPTFLEDLGKYNLVAWQKTYYGIPQSLGTIELIAAGSGDMPGVVRSESADKVKRLVGTPSRLHRWTAGNPRIANYLRRAKAALSKRSINP